MTPMQYSGKKTALMDSLGQLRKMVLMFSLIGWKLMR